MDTEQLVKDLQEAYDCIEDDKKERNVIHETWIQTTIKDAITFIKSKS